MQIKVSFVNIILDFIYVQGGPKKSVLSKKMSITPLKSIRKGKSWCVSENLAYFAVFFVHPVHRDIHFRCNLPS